MSRTSGPDPSPLQTPSFPWASSWELLGEARPALGVIITKNYKIKKSERTVLLLKVCDPPLLKL